MPVYDQSPREPVAEPLRLDGPAEPSIAIASNEIASDDASVEHDLDVADIIDLPKPLTGVDRDRVVTALTRRPGDRDRILATVAGNGFDITGL